MHVKQSREARVRNPEDVSRYGSLLLQHYKHKLAEDECEQGQLSRRYVLSSHSTHRGACHGRERSGTSKKVHSVQQCRLHPSHLQFQVHPVCMLSLS